MTSRRYFPVYKSQIDVELIIIIQPNSTFRAGVVGWCDGAGKTSSAGASY